ncbi:MAG: sigma-54-dependent Fis family transcriptional regulator, partial [Deltaproteobacteria bacterium]
MPESKNRFPLHPILIVDDEEEILRSFSIALRTGGITNILTCQDSRDVPYLLMEKDPAVILLDLGMPHMSGQELLQQIVEDFPHVPVIVITGNTEVEVAVECMKARAFDYMVKPVEKSRLISGVKRAIELNDLRKQVQILRETFAQRDLENPDAFSEIVTRNQVMLSLFRYAECIAPSPEPVLITGETGVGKELMARAIHKLSGRLGQLVAVNVAGVDDNVFSDTLFGHVKGAYTGAEAMRKGMVEQASGGTLLLDEIGDLSVASQVKLLRLLQENEYFPLGSDVAKISDARVIVTTNKDLGKLRESGDFRKDLYYRLSIHQIHIP